MKLKTLLKATLCLVALGAVAVSTLKASPQAGLPAGVTSYVDAMICTGTAALTSGTCTVANTKVAANSQIFFAPLSSAITAPIYSSSRVSGASFSVVSGTATGSFSYLIVTPQ